MFKFLRAILITYDMLISKLFHPQIPTKAQAEEANQRRLKTSPMKAERLKCASPLEKHMLAFSDADGYISAESVYLSCVYDWKIAHKEAVKFAENVMQAAFLMKVLGVFMGFKGIYGRFLPKDALDKLTHPYDSGIYNMHDGQINAERLDELEKKYAVEIDGKKMVSKTAMQLYLKDWHQKDTRWKKASSLDRLIGKSANTGEFDLLFDKVATYRKGDEIYVSMEDLRHFYLDTNSTVKALKELGPIVQSTGNTTASNAENPQVFTPLFSTRAATNDKDQTPSSAPVCPYNRV